MQKSQLNLITRRGFLSTTTKAGMAAAVASLVDIPLVMKRALAEGTIGLQGKKVLFIWLRGANDSLNSVIPIQDTEYAVSRPTLAIPKDPGTNYATVGPADFPNSVLTGYKGNDPQCNCPSGWTLSRDKKKSCVAVSAQHNAAPTLSANGFNPTDMCVQCCFKNKDCLDQGAGQVACYDACKAGCHVGPSYVPKFISTAAWNSCPAKK